MSFRALAWIHSKSDQCPIKNHVNNEPASPKPNLNAYEVSKPYICIGLYDYETLHTSKTMIYVKFEAFRASLIKKPDYFLGFLAFLGPEIK